MSTYGVGNTPYEFTDDRIRAILSRLGATLKDAVAGTDYGFTLFLTQIGARGGCFYLSSLNREDNVNALQEFIDRERPDREATASQLLRELATATTSAECDAVRTKAQTFLGMV